MERAEIKFWGWALLTVMAIVAGFSAFWKTVGWKTPAGHEADLAEEYENHTEQQQAVLNAITALSTKVDVNQDEWKCDEYEEHLVELLQRQVNDNSAQLVVDIEETRNRIADRRCTRFEN